MWSVSLFPCAQHTGNRGRGLGLGWAGLGGGGGMNPHTRSDLCFLFAVSFGKLGKGFLRPPKVQAGLSVLNETVGLAKQRAGPPTVCFSLLAGARFFPISFPPPPPKVSVFVQVGWRGGHKEGREPLSSGVPLRLKRKLSFRSDCPTLDRIWGGGLFGGVVVEKATFPGLGVCVAL